MVESKPTLFAYKHSTDLLKIIAASKLSKVDINVTTVENQILPKAVVEESSTNTYPYLVTQQGVLSEASAIVTYLGIRGEVAGSNEFERAQVAQWQLFGAYEINFNKTHTVYPIFGLHEFDADKNKEELERLKNNLKALDKHLKTRKFLLGDNFTVADIDLWASVKHLFQLVYVEQVRKNLFANVSAWFERVANHESVLSTFGPTLLCKVVQRAPKVEKKKEEPKKKEENKEETVEVKKEVKEKPAYPPESSFVFDDFKRAFSNEPDKQAVLNNLWNKDYDYQNYSIYYIRYQKLESEGKELWLTENAQDSFIQRVDHARKYGFGNLGIYGREGDWEIKGVWMWPGKGIPPFMEEHAQFEYYDKKELDPKNEADRKVIETYWLSVNLGNVVDGLALSKNIWFK